MNLGSIQSFFTSWFEDMSSFNVNWEEEPFYYDENPFIILSIGQISSPSRHTQTYEYIDAEDRFEPTTVGLRNFTLTVRCRAFDQRQAFAGRQVLEDIRAEMETSERLAELHAQNIALVRSQPIVEGSYDFDDRRIHQCNLDIIFETRYSKTKTGGSADFFNIVEGSGSYDNSGATIDVDEGPPP